MAHDEVVSVLTGDTSAVRVGADSTVYVRLTSLGTEIRRQLDAAGVPFADSLPAFDTSLPIGHTDDLVRARTGYDLLHRDGRGLPVAGAAAHRSGAAPRPPTAWQALGWTAFGALGGLGLLAAGMVVGRLYYLTSLPSGISRAAGTAVFDTVTSDLARGHARRGDHRAGCCSLSLHAAAARGASSRGLTGSVRRAGG